MPRKKEQTQYKEQDHQGSFVIRDPKKAQYSIVKLASFFCSIFFFLLLSWPLYNKVYPIFYK